MASFNLKDCLCGQKTMQRIGIADENGVFRAVDGYAVPTGSVIRWELHPTVRAYRVTLELYHDDSGDRRYLPMTADGESRFSLTLPVSELCGEEGGLFYYAYHLAGDDGEWELRCDYKTAEEYLTAPRWERNDFFQLLVYRKRETPPDWFKGGIMYHVFVDRFFSAGNNPCRADAVKYENWYDTIPEYPAYPGAPLRNNGFFGGDLQGITEKLDYLESLGVTCLYLSPIFEAYSNHKYDTGNYRKIDDMFGGEAAFRSLLTETKKRGIHVILDGVFNHTGDDSVYFNAKGRYPGTGAAQSPDSPYASWYSFRRFPDDYESWWGIRILPRVRKDSESFRSFLFDEDGVIRRYIREGIDGWRIDVADEFPDDFLCELKQAATAEKKDALVIGEVWEDASDKIAYSTRKKYLRGYELDGVMNYPIKNAILGYIRNGDAARLTREVRKIYSHYPKESADCLMNLLGTHDTIRAMTALGGKSPDGKTNDELAHTRMTDDEYATAKTRMKLAYFLCTMMPGVPCIYYGDEAGMQGYSDPLNRLPFPWGREDAELTAFYRKIGGIRRDWSSVFADGLFSLVYADADVACLLREKDGTRLVGVLNRGEKSHRIHAERRVTEWISGEEGCDFSLSPGDCRLFSLIGGTGLEVFEVTE